MCSIYMYICLLSVQTIYKNIHADIESESNHGMLRRWYKNIQEHYSNFKFLRTNKILSSFLSENFCLAIPGALSHLMPPILRQVQQVTRFQSYFQRLQMSKAVKSSTQASRYDTTWHMTTSHNSWSWRESLQIWRIKIHHGERVQRMINRIWVDCLKMHQNISDTSVQTKLHAIFHSNFCNCKPGAKVWSGGISKNVFCPQICICRFSALS